jgi:hypothetical protein
MSDIKVIVYSANIGGYDNFISLNNYDPNVEYILFTDDTEFKSDVWDVRSVDFLKDTLDNRKKARYIKLNPHLVLPPHDISIWIDHCLEPIFKDVIELLKYLNFGNSSIMCFPHPERDCLYDEGQVVLKLKLDTPEIVNTQMNRYHSMSFPRNYGLFENGFIVRRNNLKSKMFNETWWKEISKNSGRDQLSQMFVSWSIGVDITPILNCGLMADNIFLSEKIKHKNPFKL